MKLILINVIYRIPINVNMIFGKISAISRGIDQSIIFNLGHFSNDPDLNNEFLSSDWIYQYYCCLRRQKNSDINGIFLSFDDTMNYFMNSPCFEPQQDTSNSFSYGSNNDDSILTIHPRSLKLNNIYEFKTIVTNRIDQTIQFSRTIEIHIQKEDSPLIIIRCQFDTCPFNDGYQLLNLNTDIQLTILCKNECNQYHFNMIVWSIYQGFEANGSIFWNKFLIVNNNKIWLFGENSMNFTVMKNLFQNNPFINYWRFQVALQQSNNRLGWIATDFHTNQPPYNGTCRINPSTGDRSTLFTILCSEWNDDHDISHYLVYAWINNPNNLILISFTTASEFEIYLPLGDPKSHLTVHLIVHIYDSFGAMTHYP
ncbi:unnamed protein product [Rotaria sp. Silwood1]|nr:unnamed protein product [Rotaria sp. Silwood1]CAF4972543.1 unnamed protein product [Rotaria sp. Silwood1]